MCEKNISQFVTNAGSICSLGWISAQMSCTQKKHGCNICIKVNTTGTLFLQRQIVQCSNSALQQQLRLLTRFVAAYINLPFPKPSANTFLLHFFLTLFTLLFNHQFSLFKWCTSQVAARTGRAPSNLDLPWHFHIEFLPRYSRMERRIR